MPKSIYAFITALLFAGCARVPDEDLAHTIDAPSLLMSESQARGELFFEQGDWPDEKWWTMFGDPQLNRLIEKALTDNYSLKKVHAQVEYSQQFAKSQRSRLFPQLSGDYTEQWQYLSKYGFDRDFFPVPKGTLNIPHTINLIDLTLNFFYEFDFWGKNRSLFRAALGQAMAEAAEEKQAQLISAVMVAQVYFSLQAKLSQKEILQEKLNEKKQRLALTSARNTAGLDDEISLFGAKDQLHHVKQAIIFLEEGIALDKHMLKYLVGIGPDDLLLDTLPQARFDRPFPLPQNISSDLLARRPDLMAQVWRVEAAAQEIGAAKADFYPNVNLSAFAGLESLAFSNLFRDSKTGALNPAIHLPIFTGGRLQANLHSKVAAFNEAVYTYNDMVLMAAKEVADQIVSVQAVIEGYQQKFTSVQDVSSQYDLQFARYMGGIDNLFTVLNKQETVLEQRLLLIGMYLDHLSSILNLIKKLGGGFRTSSDPHSIVEMP